MNLFVFPQITRILFFLLVLAAAACSPYYYMPVTQNVPLIDEKGAGDITLSGRPPLQGDLSAAYGIGNHFAVKADGSFYHMKRDEQEEESFTIRRAEIGAGYFAEVLDDFVFEVYGFAGMGDVEHVMRSHVPESSISPDLLHARFDLIGIQPNFGYKSKSWVGVFSARFARLQYQRMHGTLIDEGMKQADYLATHRTHFLIEPAFTVKMGMEKIKFQLQYNYSINATDVFFKQKNSNFSVGINFSW